MTARFGTEFTGANWAVVDAQAPGKPVGVFDPGDRGRRAAEAECRRRNGAGVRTIADVSAVVRNAGFERVAQAADIHEEWRCGHATVFVRDDLGGAVTVLVRCPAWTADCRLPAGVSQELVAFVVDSARHEAQVRVSGAHVVTPLRPPT